MKTIELNTSETSFPPVAMTEGVSNLNTKSGVTFDGFFQNSQLQEEVEYSSATDDEREPDVEGTVKYNSMQHRNSGERGKDNILDPEDDATLKKLDDHVLSQDNVNTSTQLGDNALTRYVENISTQLDVIVPTKEKLHIVTTTERQSNTEGLESAITGTKYLRSVGSIRKDALQIPLSDGIDNSGGKEINRTSASTVELPEKTEITVNSSQHRTGKPEINEVINNLEKVIKINPDSTEGMKAITKSKADSKILEKIKIEPVNFNKELKSGAATKDSEENNNTRNQENFSLLNKDISLINEIVTDSKHVTLASFGGERFDAINQLALSFGNLFGVSMTKMIQKITQFIFKSVSTQNTQTKLTIDGGRLGSMEIQYSSESSEKQITIVVETEAARDAIKKLVPEINENLDQKGVKPSSIDVQVSNDQQKQTHEKDQTAKLEKVAPNRHEDELATVTGLNIAMKDYGYNTIEVLA